MKFIKETLLENWQKIGVIIYILVLPAVLFAQTGGVSTPSSSTQGGVTTTDPCVSSGKICNPLGSNSSITSIPAFLQALLTGVIKLGIPIVALAIIYCGFLFVFARGNSEKLTKAKDALLYTLIGAAILLGALAIATLISNTITSL